MIILRKYTILEQIESIVFIVEYATRSTNVVRLVSMI
jgi:hypothetical protein